MKKRQNQCIIKEAIVYIFTMYLIAMFPIFVNIPMKSDQSVTNLEDGVIIRESKTLTVAVT